MRSATLALAAACCVALAPVTLPAADAGTEPSVEFSVVDDAVELKAFDSATTAADIDNPNRLIIGLHQGHNAFTGFKEFRAGTADIGTGPSFVMDTISLVVTAPPDRHIAGITYTQSGTSAIGRHGRTGAAATWVVDDQPYSVGEVSFAAAGVGRTDPWKLSHLVTLSGEKRTSVTVSISAALYAVTTGTSGSASMKLLGAEVVAELAPPPEETPAPVAAEQPKPVEAAAVAAQETPPQSTGEAVAPLAAEPAAAATPPEPAPAAPEPAPAVETQPVQASVAEPPPAAAAEPQPAPVVVEAPAPAPVEPASSEPAAPAAVDPQPAADDGQSQPEVVAVAEP
jgi:hypothetical protein